MKLLDNEEQKQMEILPKGRDYESWWQGLRFPESKRRRGMVRVANNAKGTNVFQVPRTFVVSILPSPFAKIFSRL